MGVVDLAADDDGHPVALKHLVLHGSARDMARARQRIRREAEALSRLDHPNIVRLIDLVDDGDEVVLVMPYLSGGTLADHVRQSGPLAPGQVALLADTLLDALATAHREGVIHRDIKPSNVLFDDSGRAYLADFGMATIRDATSGLTATGAVDRHTRLHGARTSTGRAVDAGERRVLARRHVALRRHGRAALRRRRPAGHAATCCTRTARSSCRPTSTATSVVGSRRCCARTRAGARRRAGVEGWDRRHGRAAGPAASRPTRRSKITAGVLAAIGVVVAAAIIVAGVVTDSGTRTNVATDAAALETPSSTDCAPQPYQPCGGTSRAVHRRHALHRRPRRLRRSAGRTVARRHPTPRTARRSRVADGQSRSRRRRRSLSHSGQRRLPDPVRRRVRGHARPRRRAASMRVDLIVDSEIVDTAVSSDGQPATVHADDSSCFTSEDRRVVTRVSWAGDARTSEPYELRRSGSF